MNSQEHPLTPEEKPPLIKKKSRRREINPVTEDVTGELRSSNKELSQKSTKTKFGLGRK